MHLGYARLREACRTDVDGTSIDSLEEIARSFGFDARQVMVPIDHLLLPEAELLPAIVVVGLPHGLTHFVVVWKVHLGVWVQVMDPAHGRRWLSVEEFLQQTYVHAHAVSAVSWREWAGSDEFVRPLRRRMYRIGCTTSDIDEAVTTAASDAGWFWFARLDASVRMTERLIASGGLTRGYGACELVRRSTTASLDNVLELVPQSFWSVWPEPATKMARSYGSGDNEGTTLLLRGAVLVSCGERLAEQTDGACAHLSRDLQAAREEEPLSAAKELRRLLDTEGFAPWAVLAALGIAAAGVAIEAVLFRGLLGLSTGLATPMQRLLLVVALLIFVVSHRLLSFFTHLDVLGFGRRLENRLRIEFLERLPRINDRYFRSRPVADLAERAHNSHKLREFGNIAHQFVQSSFETLFTAAGMVWIYPSSWPFVLAAVVFALLAPLLAQPALGELDLRARTQLGALARYYLEAMVGLVAIRAHGAERALVREHETLLSEWVQAKLSWARLFIAVEGVQIFVVIGCVAAAILSYVRSATELGGILLLAYWGVNLPYRGRQAVYAAAEYLSRRNILLRLIEPLRAPALDKNGEVADPVENREQHSGIMAVGIDFEGVTVHAAGNTILRDIHLSVTPGEHVAIVGLSGAGKTTIISLLLGWHRVAAGSLRVDGAELDQEGVEKLRRHVAWVDPSVRLWDRSLLGNLLYGNVSDQVRWASLLDQSDLKAVIAKLPEGLQTSLGEGGGLVSGGEGQRVRLARAMARQGVRLVLLDEPFRGLGRDQRQKLLRRSRRLWRSSTLFCITHDISETLRFPRVLVVNEGQVVEDDLPSVLEAREGSLYSKLLGAERRLDAAWRTPDWRRLWMEDGCLSERPASE